MNLMRINGKLYNFDKVTYCTFSNDGTLYIWMGDDRFVESGPEALAAWEWLQKACIWKMEPEPETEGAI